MKALTWVDKKKNGVIGVQVCSGPGRPTDSLSDTTLVTPTARQHGHLPVERLGETARRLDDVAARVHQPDQMQARSTAQVGHSSADLAHIVTLASVQQGLQPD